MKDYNVYFKFKGASYKFRLKAKNQVAAESLALIRISHAYEINRVSDIEVKEWKGKK